jgi:hypothetical protein
MIVIRDSREFGGSLGSFGLPSDGVAYQVYPGWELWGTFDVYDSVGYGFKRMIDVIVTQTLQLTFTVGMGYYEFGERYCAGLWGSSFHIGTEDFGAPAEQLYAERGLFLCWDEYLYQPVVYQHYLTRMDTAFSLAASVTRARVRGWWYIRVEDVETREYPPTPTPVLEPTPTPTLVPTLTPTPGPDSCSNPDLGGDVEVIPVPRVAPGLCAGVGPVDVSLPLVGGISVPRVQVCFVPIWFGVVDLFGIKVNLDLVFGAAAGAMILRWLWRS